MFNLSVWSKNAKFAQNYSLQMSTPTNTRLNYFDMLKGVAIFLVVMGHVITMCVREIDHTKLFKFIEHVHMPMFFFISGWFAYKVNSDGAPVCPSPAGRAKRLLLPMLAVSTLWIFYAPQTGIESPLDSTIKGLWFNVWKNGYWFTLVLFEIFLIYAATLPVLRRCKSVAGCAAVAAAVWGVLIVCEAFVVPPAISSLLSLELLVSFYPAFAFGVVARRYSQSFMSAVHKSGYQTVAIIILCLCMYLCCWPWEFNLNRLSIIALNALLHIALVFPALAVFEHWSNNAFAPQAGVLARGVASCWQYIGQKSLAIYLLHYFFLFPMGGFRQTLLSFSVSFVPMLVFTAFWAACIIGVVLLVEKFLQPSRLLTRLLTGG